MEKKNFILMLRKDDVIDLYKFGRLYPYCNRIRYNDASEGKDLSRLADDKKTAKKFFSKCNAFDYSIEYFIAVIETADPKNGFVISDVRCLYALDAESHKIGLDLNPRINLSAPIWQDAYEEFQIKALVQDALEGVYNVGRIFEIPDLDKAVESKSLEKDMKTSCRNLVKDIPVRGKNGIWYYLLRYERHQNYPNDRRGYFLDMLHVFGNYCKKAVVDQNYSQHKIGKFLMSLPAEKKFSELWAALDQSCACDLKEINKVDKNFYKIAPLFLWIKDLFRNGVEGTDVTAVECINKIKNEMINYPELKSALKLWGYVAGRRGTYKYIYSHYDDVKIISR